MRYLAAIIITLATACATDERGDDPMTRHDQDAPEHDPAACRAACRVALGVCVIESAEDKQLLDSCTRECPFGAAELQCLAASMCGGEPTCE